MLLPGGAIGPGFKMLHEEGRTGRAWKKEMALGTDEQTGGQGHQRQGRSLAWLHGDGHSHSAEMCALGFCECPVPSLSSEKILGWDLECYYIYHAVF